MTSIPRRSVEELRLRYKLEPELRDIYVEGIFDKEIIEQLNKKLGKEFRAVYEIGTVEIPTDTLKKYDLTSGNKQRVIAFARETSDLSDDCKYLCIVDTDLDHWLAKIDKINRLNWTAYPSIELYYFSEEFTQEIIIATAKSKISEWDTFHQSFTDILIDLYSLRLADASLNMKMSFPSIEKSLAINNGKIVFKKDKYIEKCAQANRQFDRLAEYRRETDIWRSKLTGDMRLGIRGHDYIQMIAWSIKHFDGVREFGSEDAIARLLVLTAHNFPEILDLAEH